MMHDVWCALYPKHDDRDRPTPSLSTKNNAAAIGKAVGVLAPFFQNEGAEFPHLQALKIINRLEYAGLKIVEK